MCVEGFEGNMCDISKNQPTLFHCHVVSQLFLSDFCLIDTVECASFPCQNDGNCTDLVAGFECSCRAGFTGVQCGTGRYTYIFYMPRIIAIVIRL